MDLKEKFKKWLDTNPRVQIREVQLEVIADEFAIGFLEWGFNNYNMINSYDLKLLLIKYKQEKGL